MHNYTQIINLISELLYKHDCVIVPQFGGFVSGVHSSAFSKGNNLLYPPAKQVLFNKNLVHNDGLLISAYMEISHVSYAEAELIVRDFKDYLLSILAAKKRFDLINIGLLFIDHENTLRFEPKTDVNFLLESFGFEPVLAKELELDPEKPANTKVFEDRRPVSETTVKRKKSYAKIASLAVGLPVTAVLLLLAASSKPMKPILESSFNPFYTPAKTYTPLKWERHKTVLNKVSAADFLVDANGYAVFQLSDESPALVADANEVKAKLDKTTVVKPHAILNHQKFEGKYQVVVGCFGVESNAKKLVSELHSKHIAAGISGTNAKGLHVVSCGGFENKEEASALLINIKESFPNAWVMTK